MQTIIQVFLGLLVIVLVANTFRLQAKIKIAEYAQFRLEGDIILLLQSHKKESNRAEGYKHAFRRCLAVSKLLHKVD